MSSAESAQLHKSWKAHKTKTSVLEDGHAHHLGDLEMMRGQVESWRSLDERMECLHLDMVTLSKDCPS